MFARRQCRFAFLLLLVSSTSSVRADSIAEWRRVTLGGVEQSILVRGENRRNPILLFLHGGPGVSELPLAYKNRALEKEFVVVQWDQRGAGRSFRPKTPGMNVAQFVADTLHLTKMLESEFGQRKILLVGHSWGSLIGLEAAWRAPELFWGYVGLSQLVDIPRSERELDARARATAKRQGDEETLRKLEKLGRFPYPNHRVEREVNKVQKKIMGSVPRELTATRFVATALASPDYSLADDVHMLRGISFSGRALEREIYAADLFQSVRRVAVPVWFFGGRHDTVLSQVVAHEYFEQLDAPAGKQFIWFEESNHWPQIEESEKYRRELHKIRKTLR